MISTISFPRRERLVPNESFLFPSFDRIFLILEKVKMKSNRLGWMLFISKLDKISIPFSRRKLLFGWEIWRSLNDKISLIQFQMDKRWISVEAIQFSRRGRLVSIESFSFSWWKSKGMISISFSRRKLLVSLFRRKRESLLRGLTFLEWKV